MSRRGLFGATLAVTSGMGLLSMTGSAMGQEGTVGFQDARIGTSDSRTSVNSGEGWLYFETDTGDIYYGNDGSGWSSLGDRSADTDLTVINDPQSTYSTEGSSVVHVDTSSTGTASGITLTIDAASEVSGSTLNVYDIGEEASSNPITIENSDGRFVTTVDTDRGITKLMYSESRWLVETLHDGELIWNAAPSSGMVEGPIESFEDGNVAEYAGNSGNSGSSWSTINVSDNSITAPDGQYVGEMVCNGTIDRYWADTKDLTGTIDDGGITLGWWVRNSTDYGRLGFTYGRNTGNSTEYGYSVRLEYKNNEFRLTNIDTGNELDSVSFDFDANEWYYIESQISEDTETHTVSLFDEKGGTELATISGTEAGRFGTAIEWTYGWWDINNGSAQVDDVRIVDVV